MEIRHHYPANNETRKGMLDAYNSTRRFYVEVFGDPETHEMPRLEGIGVEALSPRKIWVDESMTSGDSYSGILQPEDY